MILLLLVLIVSTANASPKGVKRKVDDGAVEQSTALVTKEQVSWARTLHGREWEKRIPEIQRFFEQHPVLIKDLVRIVLEYYGPVISSWAFQDVLDTGYRPPVTVTPTGKRIDISGLRLEHWYGFCQFYKDIGDTVEHVCACDNLFAYLPTCPTDKPSEHVSLSPSLKSMCVTKNFLSRSRQAVTMFNEYRKKHGLPAVTVDATNQSIWDYDTKGEPEWEQA